ncbi:MAG: SRPBCC family protein [Halobacteriaceae archaeon]
MRSFERESRVAAPFEAVWAFHSTIDGLRALTPPWLHLQIESVVGPDGDRNPETLVPGTRIEMSVRPFGVGPRQGWTSEITARERERGSGYFRDVMRDGPFRHWEHTHIFYADGDETLLRDRVRYATPLGDVGDAIAPPFFEGMFRDRHRRTRDHFAP